MSPWMVLVDMVCMVGTDQDPKGCGCERSSFLILWTMRKAIRKHVGDSEEKEEGGEERIGAEVIVLQEWVCVVKC